MPAALPEDIDSYWTKDIYDLQVRGRVREHLVDFMERYMDEGSFNPEIHETPNFDYNFRFYTTHEAFATAVSRAVMDIDYLKFKPTATDKGYHSVLNGIWGVVTELNKPGGYWGSVFDKTEKYNVYGIEDDEPVGNSFCAEENLAPYELELKAKIIADLDGSNTPIDEWVDFVDDYEWELIFPEYEKRLNNMARGVSFE